ncbi:hypothetical protein GCM10023086_50140 [Streptomyces venetus]|uniref:GntR family transcriptional regulator n=1 Tax=Streptomyces venetus TaxID=1701086 RepID=A0ABP8GGL9_9ACTN
MPGTRSAVAGNGPAGRRERTRRAPGRGPPGAARLARFAPGRECGQVEIDVHHALYRADQAGRDGYE